MTTLLLEVLLGLLFTIALTKALAFISTIKTKPRYLPPGPSPLPLVGNLLELGDHPHKSFTSLAKIHGPLIRLKLGRLTTVVISSSTMAEEVLQTLDLTFANRTLVQAVHAHDHHLFSVVWLPVGAPWRNLRKICSSHLFSTQKLDSNQDLRYKKIQLLLADVQESCQLGVAVTISEVAFRATLNVLSSSVFSLDLTDSDSDIVKEFKEVVRCVMDEVGKPNLADYIPWLAKIDPQRVKHRTTKYLGRLLDLFDGIIDQRLELRKKVDYISDNDMLDTLLNLLEENGTEMDRNCMKHLFVDLFAAGTDTTSSTLEWAMAELLRNPNTLSKARSEIEQTIGIGNSLQESDIAQLPYLKAIIKETFRLHPAVPLLLPRKAASDATINKFTIPKDAQVMVNAWAIGRDPNIWDDPESFKPERFLGSDGDGREQNFELIPFGGGRRICAGKPLAIRMLHLMLGSLIHSFDWKLEDGVTPDNMDMEDRFGLTLQKAQPLRAIPIQL